MRKTAVVLAAALLGCGSNSYKIRSSELERLAMMPPEVRGQHVRVSEELHDADVGPPEPVTAETQVVIFPGGEVYGPERRRYYNYGGGGGGGNWDGLRVHHSGGGGLHLGGGGGDGKAEAIALLVVAAVVLVAVAAVEGSRFDGFAQIHPMQPVHIFGKDGGYAVLPLAWIDPQTAAWADHAIIRSTEGPFNPLERAPLDRDGWTYALFGGAGTYTGTDGSRGIGTATTIQVGYFATQNIGVVGSLFLGWRDATNAGTLFESRYTLELQGYPIHAGPVHFGLYGGGGGAYRIDDLGDNSSLALTGGALIQLDFNTRLALTGRLGATYAHGDEMADALIGLSVY